MLDYLVCSRARKRLLRLLWIEGAGGPVLGLADLAGLSDRSAHKELNLMRDAGLARCSREGNATVFEAGLDHPQARLLRALLTDSVGDSAGRWDRSSEVESQRTRSWLSSLGAPLHADPIETEPPPLERLLVQGARLARTDASVARSMPVYVWRHRQRLDFRGLLLRAPAGGGANALRGPEVAVPHEHEHGDLRLHVRQLRPSCSGLKRENSGVF
jgi:hypothetical protein